MPATPTPPGKRETLNIRIRPDVRNLIDRAATIQGKTRTDFVLEAARLAAEEALVDQTLIRAEPGAYAAFVERLDAPPQHNERLRAMLRTTPPWDEA